MSHADEAERLLEVLAQHDEGIDLQVTAARAQAHALLALAESVESLRPPPGPADLPVPFEQTREGWSWR